MTLRPLRPKAFFHLLTVLLLTCQACSGTAGRDVVRPPDPSTVGNITHIATQAALDNLLAGAGEGTLTVVCFTSKFCKACGPFSETFQEAAQKYADNTGIRFVAIDIYYDDSVLEKADITIVPTTQIFRGMNKVKELTGPGRLEDLAAIIDDQVAAP
jgi:thiol-disulfide isomerase/thioredoxin